MNIFIMMILGILLFRLHIYLCSKENKFVGLIIPAINFILSVNVVIGVSMYNGIVDKNSIFQYILIFIMYNIPTAILVAIYFSARKSLKKNKEMSK